MSGRLLGDQRGMALLITIMTLSLLVAVTMQFQRDSWHDFQVAHNHRVQGQLAAMARAGINLGTALLEDDFTKGGNDALVEGWARLSPDSFAGLFAGGSLELEIVDLGGRLPINGIVAAADADRTQQVRAEELRLILLRLLQSEAFYFEDADEPQAIVDALADWLDADDRESDFGAESSYYRSLPIPHEARNAPIQVIEELLLVKGVTPALFFGDDERAGLSAYLTVYGEEAKININTAPLWVIRSLAPAIGDDLAASLDEYRRDPVNEEALENAGWYRDVSGWPGDVIIDPSIIETGSMFFQIRARCSRNSLRRELWADVERTAEGEVELIRRMQP